MDSKDHQHSLNMSSSLERGSLLLMISWPGECDVYISASGCKREALYRPLRALNKLLSIMENQDFHLHHQIVFSVITDHQNPFFHHKLD